MRQFFNQETPSDTPINPALAAFMGLGAIGLNSQLANRGQKPIFLFFFLPALIPLSNTLHKCFNNAPLLTSSVGFFLALLSGSTAALDSKPPEKSLTRSDSSEEALSNPALRQELMPGFPEQLETQPGLNDSKQGGVTALSTAFERVVLTEKLPDGTVRTAEHYRGATNFAGAVGRGNLDVAIPVAQLPLGSNPRLSDGFGNPNREKRWPALHQDDKPVAPKSGLPSIGF